MCANAIAGNKSNTKKAPWGAIFLDKQFGIPVTLEEILNLKNNRNLNGVVGADGIEPPTFCV